MKMRPPSARRFLATHFRLILFLPMWLLAQAAHAAPPEAKLTVVRPVIAGQSVSARMLATDAEGDALTFELVQTPAQGTVVLDDPRTGAFTYTANANPTRGRDSFTFRARDASGSSGVQTVHITLQRVRRSVAVTGSNSAGQIDVSGWHDIAALAAGEIHTVGLKVNGSVVAVGHNADGQLNVGSWRDIVAVAAGHHHTVGVKDDGTVLAAGLNDEGQTDVGGWSDIVAVAAGADFTVGLKANGTAVLAGNDRGGQSDVSAWRDIITVAAGDYHLVGLKVDGTAVAVGNSGSGLGVSGWDNLVAVTAGGFYTLGVKSDGTVVTSGTQDAWHAEVDTWRDIAGVAAGSVHIVGVKHDGTVVSAGPKGQYYDVGQFDVDDWQQAVAVAAGYRHTVALTANLIPTAPAYTLYVEPGQPATTDDLLALASDPEGDPLSITGVIDGSHGTVVNHGNGTLTYMPQTGFTGSDSFSYMLNDSHGGIVATTVPVIVATDWDGDGLPNLWEQGNGLDPVDAADDQGADGDPDGDRYTNLEEHQHGTDPQGAVSHPDLAPLARLTLVRPVIAGGSMSAQLHANDRNGPVTFEVVVRPEQGSVVVDANLGSFTYTAAPDADGRDHFSFRVRNAHGVSAQQTVHLTIRRDDNDVVAAGSNSYGQIDLGHWQNIAAVAAGENHTVGLVSDGTVVAAGDNSQNQLNLSGWQDIVAVAASREQTIGLKDDGTVVATGRSTEGQLNVGGWRDIVAVATGYEHTVGLRSDGTVLAVGSNYGQLAVSDWRDVVAVAAGAVHTVGLKADGTVLAAGINLYGVTDVIDVTGWRDVIAVATGFSHTVGLKPDGTVLATGDNSYGQRNVSGWSDVVALTAGYFHTMGVRADGTVVAAGLGADLINDSRWSGVVSAAAGGFHTVGFKAPNFDTAVAQPTFTPPPGRYHEGVLVTIATTTAGARLRYTLDGTTPSRTRGTEVANGAAVQIDESATLKVIGFKDGRRVSDVSEAAYTISTPATQGGGGGIGLPFLGLLGIMATLAGWRHHRRARDIIRWAESGAAITTPNLLSLARRTRRERASMTTSTR
jgi:alpha-tubulin suppressor-like RCC1 family protein